MSTSLNILILIVLLNNVYSVPIKRQTEECSYRLYSSVHLGKIQKQTRNNFTNLTGEMTKEKIKQLYDLTTQDISQLLTNSSVTELDVGSALVARNVCDLYAAHQSASKLNNTELECAVAKRCNVVKAYFGKFNETFDCESNNTSLYDNNSTNVLLSLCLYRMGQKEPLDSIYGLIREATNSGYFELDPNNDNFCIQ